MTPPIYVPRVYDEYASRRVLVLEWIDGIKINDYAALDAAGVDRQEVASRRVRAYFFQFFQAGFFHADPHPGNIFVKKGSTGERPAVAFVDFGMVGSLTTQMKRFMKDAFLAYLTRDTHALVRALSRLGFIDESANTASIERAMWVLIERYHGMTLGEMSELDAAEIIHDIEYLLYGQPFHIPAQFAFAGRAIGTLVGVSTGLSPEFDFVEVATPYARQFLGLDAAGAQQTLLQLFQGLLDAGRAWLALPRSLEQVMTRLVAGQIEVKLANNQPDGWFRMRWPRSERARGVSRGAHSFAWPLMFAASLAGGIFLLTNAHQSAASWFCFGLAGLAMLKSLVRS